MNKGFVPYDIALALKELGFDEPCVGTYHDNSAGEIKFTFGLFQHPKRNSQANTVSGTFIGEKGCYAPLYQQAFRWFREEYNCHYNLFAGINKWSYVVVGVKQDTEEGFDTHEEAELACLRKLIEIVKENL